jgi:hypothetical protein
MQKGVDRQQPPPRYRLYRRDRRRLIQAVEDLVFQIT